jgi:hypothetical protein
LASIVTDIQQHGDATTHVFPVPKYELAVVQTMDYQIAWELAKREWAFLPDEEDQPQLSFGPATLDPKTTVAHDFRITDADEIGQGRLREKTQANLAAIRTLKRIEGESGAPSRKRRPTLLSTPAGVRCTGAFEVHSSRDWKGIADELR